MPTFTSREVISELSTIKSRYLDRTKAADDTRRYGVIVACQNLAELHLNKSIAVKFSSPMRLSNGKTVVFRTCRINSWTDNDGMWGFDSLELRKFSHLIGVTMEENYDNVNFYIFTSDEVQRYAIQKRNGQFNLKFYIDENLKAPWAKAAKNAWEKLTT